jgi:hypothetical protein
MNPKIADYLASLGTLIVATTFDEFSELIPLGCNLNRMPTVEPFRFSVAQAVPRVLSVIAKSRYYPRATDRNELSNMFLLNLYRLIDVTFSTPTPVLHQLSVATAITPEETASVSPT